MISYNPANLRIPLSGQSYFIIAELHLCDSLLLLFMNSLSVSALLRFILPVSLISRSHMHFQLNHAEIHRALHYFKLLIIIKKQSIFV